MLALGMVALSVVFFILYVFALNHRFLAKMLLVKPFACAGQGLLLLPFIQTLIRICYREIFDQ